MKLRDKYTKEQLEAMKRDVDVTREDVVNLIEAIEDLTQVVRLKRW